MEGGGGGLLHPHPRGACGRATSTAAQRCSAGISRSPATIVHGDKRGRELGYPTANMALDPASELAHGIYAVRFLARRRDAPRRRGELRPPPDLRRRRAGARDLRLRFLRRPLRRGGARRLLRLHPPGAAASTASPRWSRRWSRIRSTRARCWSARRRASSIGALRAAWTSRALGKRLKAARLPARCFVSLPGSGDG